MRYLYFVLLLVVLFTTIPLSAEDIDKESIKQQAKEPLTNSDPDKVSAVKEIYLGINTADVREDTSSVQFLNLFRSAIPFSETVPWGSSKQVTYDENGWPNDLKEGQAGTKFLNRLPEDTVEGGFFTVLYDGEGEIFYGNDARLVVHRPNKDIIEIHAGKDKILNASLFVKKSNPENYIRNIRILPEGGICKGATHLRVKSPDDCSDGEYLSFEDNHLNPWAKEQRQALTKPEAEKKDTVATKEKEKNTETDKEVVKEDSDNKTNKTDVAKKEKQKDLEEDAVGLAKGNTKNNTKDNTKNQDDFVIKGFTEPHKALLFNPEYLNFMKDFQMVRFMNMSGMTRNPVFDWDKRNTLKKATWGGKYGSRGAPVEIMVALSNQVDAYPWFSMPYKASDDYIEKFGEYVNENLNSGLKTYIEYSNEVWNPIFSHHDYAIAEGMKQKLDKKKSQAGYKWYSKRSVQTFKLWETVFGGTDRLIRVMGSWASNQIMSSTVLEYEDAYKHTDAIAIGPYFSAHPRVLRRAKTVDDVFKSMLNKKTKWGMESTINYIQKQAKVAASYGVDLVAYEGGQHLVDWNTRKADEHPNQLLYAANRDPRMGILYDELMNEWQRAGGKLFVAFSAPRIYSWYGSWGIKEHIRQARSDAPKYDSLLRYLNTRLYPKKLPQAGINSEELAAIGGEVKNIKIAYAKTPQMIWDMSKQQQIKTDLKDYNSRDIDAHWQANWDTKNLYLSFAISDDNIHTGDEISLTLDTTSAVQDLEKEKAQEKRDIANEKALLEKQKKAKAARKIEYERIAKEKKEKTLAIEKEKNKENNTKKVVSKDDKESLKKKSNTEDTTTASPETKIKVVKDEKSEPKSKQVSDIKFDKETKDAVATIETKIKNTVKSDKTQIEDKTETTSDSVTQTVVNKDEKDNSKAVIKDAKTSDKETKNIEETNTQLSKDENKEKNNDGEKIEEDVTEEDVTEEVNEDSGTESESESEPESKPSELTEQKPEPTLKKSFAENVITFTLTPFDELNRHSRLTRSDAGYLINVAIPWSEIYYDTDIDEIHMKSGDRLGVNIVVKDYDKDEKGNKELISADTNLPLPKLILKNILIQ